MGDPMSAFPGKLRLVAVAGGLAFAAVLGTASQASAVAYEKTMKTDDGDPGGIIKFAANGDYVEVCDIEPDGYAVRGTVDVGTGRRYSLHVGGNGNCVVTSAAVSGHDLKENACLEFDVALYKNDGYDEYRDRSWWHNSSPVYDC